jgi:hypothetical protein
MWWRILVALVLTLPPVAYVAGALANDEQHREPHPTVVLNTGGTDRDGTDRSRGKDQQKKRDRGDKDERPGKVTVVRPGPVAVGDDGGDDDDGDDDTDDADDTYDTDDD